MMGKFPPQKYIKIDGYRTTADQNALQHDDKHVFKKISKNTNYREVLEF